jgi:hypothetical protein
MMDEWLEVTEPASEASVVVGEFQSARVPASHSDAEVPVIGRERWEEIQRLRADLVKDETTPGVE